MDHTPIIQFNQVDVVQDKKLILSQVNLEVMPGEFLYLIGKTGSGKSSLLKIVYADLGIKTGTANACGFDLGTIRKKEVPFLRRKLGIIFQDFKLFDDRNVKQNLDFVLKATGWKDKEKIDQRILEVLEVVGLIDKLNSMPHKLSGGEQQKIAIARALLNKPEVILADEPTGNLDPETSNGIMKLLLEINKGGTTVIMATHNYNLIYKFPGNIVKCEDGAILSSTNKLD